MTKSWRSTMIVAAALILYVAAVMLRTEFWADLVAPVFSLLVAGLVFHAIFTSANKAFRPNFILAGAAIVSWAVADILWFVYAQLLFVDPDSSTIIAVFYFGTNVFLVASTILYAFYRLRKWNTVQLILDGVTFSLAILWLAWVMLYDKNIDQLGLLMNRSIMNTLTVAIDVFMIVVIGIWYLSIRKGKLPAFLRILVGSVAFYAIVDLVYYDLYIRDLYTPDTLLDICYLVTLFGIAVSIKMYYVRYPSVYTDQNPNTNIGFRHRGLILVLCPVVIIIFNKIDVVDIVLYSIVILVHETSSNYIQKTINDRALLEQEKNENKKLEQLVSEKTQDLKSANDELRQRNEDLRYSNLHDPLTGLYNRTYFMDTLEYFFRTVAPEEKITMLLWNVDNLKGINDTYGHFTGDKLLIWHADSVRKLSIGDGVLVRLGGDEFAILLKGKTSPLEPYRIAEQVVHSCKEPFQISGYTISISVSVGICQYPTCSSDKSELLKHADVAMQYTKDTKPENHISMYMDIDLAMQRKHRIGKYLKIADYNRDFRLHFQPQFRISDRMLIGMEALLRWDCPEIGPVSPAEFIPIAEAENLIIPIGNWVIDHAIQQIVDWNRAYMSDFRIGINISPKQFDQSSTFDVLEASVKRHKAAAKWIDIEITEGVALDNEDSTENIRTHFRNRGISISIDDFGTGYSSLGYLSILSFDRLKIAKPLIDKITRDDSSRKIVTSIILLAKSLGLQTIAEGVETEAQFDLLLSLGCDQIQGFYLGRPVPAEEFEALYLKDPAAV